MNTNPTEGSTFELTRHSPIALCFLLCSLWGNYANLTTSRLRFYRKTKIGCLNSWTPCTVALRLHSPAD